MGIPNIKIIITGQDKLSFALGKASKSLNKIGKRTAVVGKRMTQSLTLPILGIGAAASKAALDINKSLANVETLIPGNTKRVIELKKSIQDLSISTGKGTTKMSEGLFQVISAFGDSADTVKKLEINARAAVAGVSTVEEAINLTSAVTKGYGDVTLKTTQDVADLAFKANELGQTTFREMAESIGKVTPMAATLGVTMKEVFGVIATGTGVTGDTSMVNTQLSAVLGALMKPTTDMEIAFKKLGVASGKQLIKQKGFQGALEAIVNIADKYDVRLGKLLGRKEALNLALALTGKSQQKFTDNLKAMGNASGAAEKAFKAQTEGINKIGFRFAQAKQRVIVLAQRLGDRLLPILADLAEKYIVPLLDKLDKLNNKQIKWGIIIAGAVAVIGPLTAVIGTLVTVFGKVGLAIAAFSGLITYMVTNSQSKLTKLLTYFFPLAGVMVWVIKRWKRVLPFIKLFIFAIVAYFKLLWKLLKPIVTPLANLFMWVGDLIFKVLDKALGALEKLANVALPDWVKKKIGLATTASAEAASGREVLKTMSEQSTQKSEFNGTLKIVGAPVGSQLEVTEGEMDVELDSGIVPVGTGF